MKLKPIILVAITGMVLIDSANAQAQESMPAVNYFTTHAEHCFYMLDYPEGSDNSYHKIFIRDVQAAVAELADSKSPQSIDKALFALHERCINSIEARFRK